MATVAPVSSSPWIPEDDLLLKNAVEAGASLEALAKGAVQFSRRFTIGELQDRWHSLLYDPDISAQACARMVELEHSGSNPALNFNRNDNSNGNGRDPYKRKIGNIRREYYAMRKRIRSELFNSTDLGFLPEPGIGDHGVHFQEHLRLDNEPRCISDTFELQETDLDILRQAFPETLVDIAPSSNTAAFTSQIENNHPNIYGFSENVSPLRNNGTGSFEPIIKQEDATCMLENNVMVEVLPNQNLFETEDSQTKPLPHFDAINDNPQNIPSQFGGVQHFNSPDLEDNPSGHLIGFSPLPRLPLWKTMEDISAPAMPVSGDNGDRSDGVEGTSKGPKGGDHMRESPPRYDGTHPEPAHDNPSFINQNGMSEGDFVDISDSLLNFGNDDEILFMGVHEKDHIDKSCYDHLHSILLSSPNDLQDGELHSIEPEVSGVPTTEIEKIGSPVTVDESPAVPHAEVDVAPVSLSKPDPLEHKEGNICCTLNTEDPEIPCNDDIFLLIHPNTSLAASTKQPIIADSIEPLSSSADEKDFEQGLNLIKENGKKMGGRCMLPESGPGLFLPGHAVKSDLSGIKRQALPVLTGNSKKGLRGLIQQNPTNANLFSTADGSLEEDISKAELMVIDNQDTFREVTPNAEASSSIPESSVKPSSPDQDELESDEDVPYFSDIEAMIFEMDLGSYDEEPYISKRVSRYQLDGNKRRIIRLEQCARSALQRAMTSQDALGILYGRHLKHYIRKTEVILGRSTDDVDVDIDLRKEGRANKISRRQAIIKVESDGTFFLKNLGKNSISVNGKPVATGQLMTLSSSCLIEIKGMSFIFEINHKYLRRWLENNTEKSRGKLMRKFDWVPEGEQ